jgi:xylulose-5-phosphate/fructose-6-phosphate phosphoketolase
MVVLNYLDRFHLVADVIDRVPSLGSRAAGLKQHMRDQLSAHRAYINQYGQDMPEVRNWRWGGAAAP